MGSFAPRLFSLIVATALAAMLVSAARQSWMHYWLLQDGRQGMAMVTSEVWSGHNAVNYKYVGNHKEFAGASARNWKEEKYRNVRVGEESVVFFSASHPWLSALSMPDGVITGLPGLIVALLMEFFFVMTVINPKGRWALKIRDRKQTDLGL
jgi:hypothetical protein